MKSTFSKLLAALALALVATSASAQTVPPNPPPGISDAIVIVRDGTEVFRFEQPEAPIEPLLFVSANTVASFQTPTNFIALNLQAGVTVYLEPGSLGGILPTNTFFDPANMLFGNLNTQLARLVGPSSNISDLFGITSNFNATSPEFGLIGFGLLSDLDGSQQLNIGSFGLPTGVQALRFRFEPGVFENVGNVFFVQQAIGSNNNQLFVFSDVEAVPDGGMTLSLLGLGLTGIAFLRRKLA